MCLLSSANKAPCKAASNGLASAWAMSFSRRFCGREKGHHSRCITFSMALFKDAHRPISNTRIGNLLFSFLFLSSALLTSASSTPLLTRMSSLVPCSVTAESATFRSISPLQEASLGRKSESEATLSWPNEQGMERNCVEERR